MTRLRRLAVPLFSFLLLVGTLMSSPLWFWLLPDGPIEPRLPLSVFGPLLLVPGWLSWKFYDPRRAQRENGCEHLRVPRDRDHRRRTDPALHPIRTPWSLGRAHAGD